MHKRLKNTVLALGSIVLLILVLWFSIYYKVNYQKTVCDNAISPDSRYELTLLSIGEPDWPFGSASGRLILTEGDREISRTDFELCNDGAMINPGCWTVDWLETGVEVVLSGEEQEDEHILMYFDGTISYEAEPVEDSLKLEFHVMENRESELVWDIPMDDFIESYNSFYLVDHVNPYLRPKSEWRMITYDNAVHSDYETSLYEFSLDENVWSQPTITVYVPTNGDYIQEVTINFDQHGYSETFYAHFEELCFYTLKVFFPEMNDETIIALYEEANRLGNLNVFLNEDGYERGCVPCVLYHKDGIGVYPYFAIGEWTHLCIIPVDEEMLDTFAKQGVEVYEIE